MLRVLVEEIVKEEDMINDALDALMVFDHLLMMTTALIRRPRAYTLTNHLVYF